MIGIIKKLLGLHANVIQIKDGDKYIIYTKEDIDCRDLEGISNSFDEWLKNDDSSILIIHGLDIKCIKVKR